MKKMISRRNFLKAAALAGSAMALTACGGKGSAGDKAAAAVVVDGPVEFRPSWWTAPSSSRWPRLLP